MKTGIHRLFKTFQEKKLRYLLYEKPENSDLTIKSNMVAGRHFEQDAQLSQRDRAAGYISFGRTWKTGTPIQ